MIEEVDRAGPPAHTGIARAGDEFGIEKAIHRCYPYCATRRCLRHSQSTAVGKHLEVEVDHHVI